MRCTEVLHKYLKKSCSKIHKTRLKTLCVAVEGAMKGKVISVTGIGRNIESQTTTKHDIKRIDRLINNAFLPRDKLELTKAILNTALPKVCPYLLIIVDESVLDERNERKMIRFSLALEGRPITLYEEIYLNGSFKKKALNFLLSLKEVIGDHHRVIIISDAGFFPSWFKRINTIKNWYWLGRISLNYNYQFSVESSWYKTDDLQEKATTKPTTVGEILLTKAHRLKASLYSYKQCKKGRFKKNKLGHCDMTKTSIEKRKSANKAWIIATSLPADQFNAEQIIGFYRKRMQIEESFRDLKSSRYGFSFNLSLTKDIYRLNNLLFIGYLAMWIAWLIGLTGEIKKVHRFYQSNTTKNRRILSLPYLGHAIYKKNAGDVRKKDIQYVFSRLKTYLAILVRGECYGQI